MQLTRESVPRRFETRLLLIFLVVGIASLAWSVYLGYTTHQFLGRAVEVPGKVVRMIEKKRHRKGSTYAPVVVFTDREGRVRNFQSKQSSYPPLFVAGEIVTVVYDPADSSYPAKIRSFWELWGLTVFAAAFGMVFTGLPLAFWFRAKRRG